MLIDAHGRQINYVRLSVTDRCDLRCAYCMPPEFSDYEKHDSWMSFEETERLCRIFVNMGISRIRLTGGEPLVRARVSDLVHRIGAIPGLTDLSLSTNGTQLKKYAEPLKKAGVSRLNVSLDTLSRERFIQLTRRDALPSVLEGLEVARALDFQLIKINMVWLPDVNGDEIDAMIEYCRERNFVLRLIENMPVGASARQLGSRSLQPLIEQLREKHQLVNQVIVGGGPARYLKAPDDRFSLGFITPISQHFCETCNRIRVAASGTLHLCLGQEHQVELLPLLRASSATDADIAHVIREAINNKPLKHEFVEAPEKIIRFMSSTGG